MRSWPACPDDVQNFARPTDPSDVSLRPVFHEPTGRRSRTLRSVLFGAAALLLLLVGSVAIGIVNPPVVEPLPLNPGHVRRGTESQARAGAKPCTLDGPASRRNDHCRPMPSPRHAGAAIPDPIVAAFVVQWDAASRAALKRIGERLDWVIIEGAFLGRGAPGEVSFVLDPDVLADARARGADVHVMITNFGSVGFDSLLAHAVVATPARRANTIKQLTDVVQRQGLKGVTVDFELVPSAMHAHVIAFLTELRRALHPMGAQLSVAVPIGDDDGYPLRLYSDAVDYLIPMLYDEHADEDAPGPVASAAWFAGRLDLVLSAVPANKVIVGLGQYGYHWRSDRPQAVTISAGEALALSRAGASGPTFSPTMWNPTATWRDAAAVTHTVWYLDAVTAWNQVRTTLSTGALGVAIWRLGSEDATLWRVLDRRGIVGSPDSLRALPNNGVSVISGDGEVLAVEGSRGNGLRAIGVDASGNVATESVIRPPGGYIVSRGGVHTKRVALTFDDGPDPLFTAQILDTLKSRNARASFFVIGRQVQKLPDLTRRIAAEGHEIGNHSWSHADLSGLSDAAIRVELTATGRVVETVTGQRPLLFRPPYIGDARPATEDRLRPMAIANELGYRIAGLEVDPKDWFESDAQVIVANALRSIRRGSGRIILLHDAGGDRTPTLAALGPLIDSLRANGFELSTVAGLLNAAQTAGMASAPRHEASQRLLNFAALRFANVVESLLVGVFFVAMVLGLLRLVGIGGLAVVQRFRRPHARRASDARYQPRVSVIIPAFNEARIIARTIASVLTQDYADFEVIVIDDGSTDGTHRRATAASNDPRVRVVRQSNAGKAAALNHGLTLADGDIVVVIDADTLLAPFALQHAIQPLADERVGAVAGNAKVGNRVNLLTKWQAIEYVTSQNLDRRAFSMLNCITVVPGAIGAWRRSAVLQMGGFCSDTLAEDQDLTLTLLRGGYRVALADQAIALTEAPETFQGLLKQRFRWSFGTLQCAWKHRAALLRPRHGALGLVGLPNIWLFQLFFPLLAPAADFALLATLARLAIEAPAIGAHAAWAHAQPVLSLYVVFLVIDTITAGIGVALESGERWSQVLLVPLQRVAYRQVLYIALVKAVRAALKGWAPGWGKLERTGRVEQRPTLVPNPRTLGRPAETSDFTGRERRRKAS